METLIFHVSAFVLGNLIEIDIKKMRLLPPAFARVAMTKESAKAAQSASIKLFCYPAGAKGTDPL